MQAVERTTAETAARISLPSSGAAGIYIADFVCHQIKLIIEVDGGQHGEDETRLRDERRTQWLEGRGYQVIRFWNQDVLFDLESVMNAVESALQARDLFFRHRNRPS